MKDIRNELYNHMVDCAPDNAGFNDVQKSYILEYMQRYLDSQKNENINKNKKLLITLSESASIIARYCQETGMELSDAINIVSSIAKNEIKNVDELPNDELSNN